MYFLLLLLDNKVSWAFGKCSNDICASVHNPVIMVDRTKSEIQALLFYFGPGISNLQQMFLKEFSNPYKDPIKIKKI